MLKKIGASALLALAMLGMTAAPSSAKAEGTQCALCWPGYKY
ncbi:hypothetical protein [Georgenia sp. TF02-10]|nr:hypothetical protein [Georgenia sp. TF02-10]